MKPRVIYKIDWVIANFTGGPLIYLEFLAFKMHGDTKIYGNFPGSLFLIISSIEKYPCHI